jgi:predicted permease
VLTARIALPQRYTPELRIQFAQQLLARASALPSVRNVTVASDLPLGGNRIALMIYVPTVEREFRSYRHSITPDYFVTLGIPLVRGRAFASTDVRGTEPVVIVSDAMARRFWGTKDPIGTRLRLGSAEGPEVTVVGVAGSARFRDLSSDLSVSEPDVYFPLLQRPSVDVQIALRSDGDATQLAGALRREVLALDPGLPIFNVDLLGTQLRRQTATARFGSFVLTAFGSVALLLAAIGIYGALAFLVSLGRREIAIRMALGATTSAVLRRVVSQGAALAIAGLILGLLGARIATRAIGSQLFGVSPTDPATFVTVGALMLLVALAASYLPARRATRVDPQLALKGE